jgi:hypothetical protein
MQRLLPLRLLPLRLLLKLLTRQRFSRLSTLLLQRKLQQRLNLDFLNQTINNNNCCKASLFIITTDFPRVPPSGFFFIQIKSK